MYLTELSELEINIEGYSGPFDLLCSLVEDRKFKLTGIKVSQLIKIYGLYLIQTRQAPADTLAEFFYLASNLLLEKTRSLIPGYNDEHEDMETEQEQQFMRTLERYMPYRKIYHWLSEKFNAQSLLFRHESKDETRIAIVHENANVLSEALNQIRNQQAEIKTDKQESHETESNVDWDGFTGSDNQQIDERVSEIENLLRKNHSLSFNELCRTGSALLTLLAILELCRMGKVLIEQKELFSDVRIITKT